METEKIFWYAMRATYCRELQAQKILERKTIKNYIPMCYKTQIKKRKKTRELVPIISNLIFVYNTPSAIKQVKAEIPYLQYMTEKKDNKNVPITIPECQMEKFIAATKAYNDELIYLNPEEINMKKGTKVRICGGLFDGQEGLFIKIKGHKKKQVVISIQGVIAIANVNVSADMIEIIK